MGDLLNSCLANSCSVNRYWNLTKCFYFRYLICVTNCMICRDQGLVVFFCFFKQDIASAVRRYLNFSLELKKTFTWRFCIMLVSLLLTRTLGFHHFGACGKAQYWSPLLPSNDEVTPVMLQWSPGPVADSRSSPVSWVTLSSVSFMCALLLIIWVLGIRDAQWWKYFLLCGSWTLIHCTM